MLQFPKYEVSIYSMHGVHKSSYKTKKQRSSLDITIVLPINGKVKILPPICLNFAAQPSLSHEQWRGQLNLQNYTLETLASVYSTEFKFMPFFSLKGLKLIQVSEAQTLSSQYVFLPEESHSLLQNILTLGSETRKKQLVGVSCFIKKMHKRVNNFRW